MLFKESETVELKEIVTDDIKKEIIAFANSDGGKLYIGVCDDGSVVGVKDPDSVSLQISNMIRDTIRPDITMFIHYDTLNIDDKEVVMIDIQRGVDRPYYLAKKGMRPEGVYVRQGNSSAPASESLIRRMIKETDGDRFEAMRSLYQDLTFEVTKKEFKVRDIDLGQKQMRTLKLVDQDGLYSNLGLLLSDQCPFTIKVAVFQGTDQMIFMDRREFGGSVLGQMNDVYDYIDIYNKRRSTIEGLYRIDTRDYPSVSIREALLNLLVHRDYSFSASAFISLYDDRIEFVSIGGIVPGIDLEDIMAGVSVCRNQDLANVFYRLQLIEAYGTGISKIMKAYEGSDIKPEIKVTNNTFKVILPNMNHSKVDEKIINEISNEEKVVIDYIKMHGLATRSNVVELLGVSTATASRLLKRLEDKSHIKRNGKGRSTYYTLFF